MCKEHISAEQNFFSTRFDEIKFWSAQVAWAYPPFDRKMIMDVLQRFRVRKMRGYLCVLNHKRCHREAWCEQLRRESAECVTMRMCNQRSKDALILYYDFQ